MSDLVGDLRRASDSDEADGGFSYILMRSAAAELETTQQKLVTAISLLLMVDDPSPGISFAALADRIDTFLHNEVPDLSNDLTGKHWLALQKKFSPLIGAAQAALEDYTEREAGERTWPSMAALRKALEELK